MLYTEDKLESGKRSDWAQIEAALEAGHDVYIRPATLTEYGYYTKKLRELNARIKNEDDTNA